MCVEQSFYSLPTLLVAICDRGIQTSSCYTNFLIKPRPFDKGHSRWHGGKETTTYQCRRHRFNPYVDKISWRRQCQHTLIFLPEKPMDREGWRATAHVIPKSQTWLNKHICTHLMRDDIMTTYFNLISAVIWLPGRIIIQSPVSCTYPRHTKYHFWNHILLSKHSVSLLYPKTTYSIVSHFSWSDSFFHYALWDLLTRIEIN